MQRRQDGFAWSMAALVVRVRDKAILAVVAEPGENFGLPALGPRVLQRPHFVAVIRQRGLVDPPAVVLLIENGRSLQPLLDVAELLEGRSDVAIGTVDPDGQAIGVPESKVPMALEDQVRVVAHAERSQPLRDDRGIALGQESGIAVAGVDDHPLIGVFQAAAPAPNESLELPPVARHLPGGCCHVVPVHLAPCHWDPAFRFQPRDELPRHGRVVDSRMVATTNHGHDKGEVGKGGEMKLLFCSG
jgi:hypothetical protein